MVREDQAALPKAAGRSADGTAVPDETGCGGVSDAFRCGGDGRGLGPLAGGQIAFSGFYPQMGESLSEIHQN